MSDPTSTFTDPSSPTREDISAAIKRVAAKILLITEAVKGLHHDRNQLEIKIEDAQKRIQHILSRLPEQSDSRQLNLLGAAAATPTPEDDNEPTTH